jgi:hypothetical protein
VEKQDIAKGPLLALVHEIDTHLQNKIDLYAVGGTAMTLLNLKASTKDIDFNVDSKDAKEFKTALGKTIHGYRVDLYFDGIIFTQQLPADYADKAISIKEKLNKINLFSIYPVDIVVSKIGRLNDRDFEDIKDCITKYKLTAKQIEERGKKLIYAGNEENYKYNLKDVLVKMFNNKQ